MYQEVNYIEHHKNANSMIMEFDLNPTHISLYNALFLIWNKCGFQPILSINRNDIMMLSKIGSKNTYTKCLYRLQEVKLIEYNPSKNPLKGSTIKMYRFDNSNGKSNGLSSGLSSKASNDTLFKLSKLVNYETLKLAQKEEELTAKFLNENLLNFINSNRQQNMSIDTIDKFPFNEFWDLYDKKIGKSKCEPIWKRLKEEDKEAILAHVPKYKKAQPNKQYRSNPQTYLFNRGWEDEIIEPDKPKEEKLVYIRPKI